MGAAPGLGSGRGQGLNCCHEALSFAPHGMKLYCFRDRVHFFICLFTVFSANPVSCSEELRGDPF